MRSEGGSACLACYHFAGFPHFIHNKMVLLTRAANAMPSSSENIPVNGHEVDPSLVREIAGLIVASLNLDVAEAEIDPAAPLYREGLGLDSIDILEIALVVSKRYGFKLKEDDQDNVRIFTSLNSLAAHVAERRTK
jgi:acyl carrier protein